MPTAELEKRLVSFAEAYKLIDGHEWIWTSSPKTSGNKAGGAQGVLTICDSSNGAAVGYLFCSGGPQGPQTEERICILFESFRMRLNQIFTMAKMYMSTKALNFIDDLTGLYNSRYMARVLDTEISRVDRDSSVFSVLFVDVDHLKRVNDEKGHLMGSQVLVEVGKILQDAVRTTDYAFRYGGDEFILVLVGADEVESRVVAERIRSRVEKHSFLYKGHELRVTLSVGIAAFPKHAKTRDDLIRMADEAMYAGKRKSRNTVFVAS
jgi:diguanylate cyclase (GGDEF)-like protein